VENAIWQIYACVYDLILQKFIPYRKVIDRTLAALTPERNRRYLDAGCGTGNFLLALAKTDCGLHLTGIDFSPAMLKRAAEKLRKESSGVDLLAVNLNQRLPFADHIFDGVICSNVIYAVADPALLVNELARVLSCKGRLILTTPMHEPKMVPIIKEHISHLVDMHGSSVGMARFIWQLALVALPAVAFVILNMMIRGNGTYHFFKRLELETLLEKSGLKIVELYQVYGAQNWFVIAEKDS
jgi:ubiquinone/menaquinone biosynthesis C-methylase UbiE